MRKGRLDKYRRQERDRGCNFSTNKRPGHPRGDTVHNLICTSETKRHHPLSFFPLSLPYSPSPLSLSLSLVSSIFLSVFFLRHFVPLSRILRCTMLCCYQRVSGRRDTSTLTNEQIACGWRNKAPHGLPPVKQYERVYLRFRNTLLDACYPQCQFSSVCRNDVIIRMSLRCR